MYKNSEGYADPTAGQALANARLAERRELEKYINKTNTRRGLIEKSIKKATSLKVE